MKRIPALLTLLTLLIATLLAVVSCGEAPADPEGYFTADGKGYFVTASGYLTIESGAATVSAGKPAAEGTPASVVFDAPKESEGSEYFLYSGEGARRVIIGLTDLGKQQTVLFAPADASAIASDALKDAAALKAFVIGTHAAAFNLASGAFNGTSGVTLYLACAADNVTCGQTGLNDGASDLAIRVVSPVYNDFKTHYTWSAYASLMKKL